MKRNIVEQRYQQAENISGLSKSYEIKAYRTPSVEILKRWSGKKSSSTELSWDSVNLQITETGGRLAEVESTGDVGRWGLAGSQRQKAERERIGARSRPL